MRNKHINSHHVIFERRLWESSPNGRELRNYEGLIVPMKKSIHEKLHEDCFLLPNIPGDSIVYMLETLDVVSRENPSTVEMIGALATCGLDIRDSGSCRPREYRNMGIFVHNILAQVPYILEGAIVNPVLVAG